MIKIDSFEHFYYVLSVSISAFTLLLAALIEKKSSSFKKLANSSPISLFMLFSLCVGFTLFRYYLSTHAFGNVLTPPDENFLSRIYTGSILQGKPICGGVTHLTHALFYWIWYSLFGCCSVAQTRSLSWAIGTASVYFFYKFVKIEFNQALALIATLFFSMGTYLELYSVIAIQVIGGIFFSSLFLYLIANWKKSKRANYLYLAASVFPFGVLSYAGFTLFVAAIMISIFIVEPKHLLSLLKQKQIWLAIGITLLFMFLFAGIDQIFYNHPELSPYPAIEKSIRGGGGFPTHFWEFANSFFSNIYDTIGGGNSIYVHLLPVGTFVEPSLWGLFLLGIYHGMQSENRWLKVLACASGLVFLINLCITLEPGLRRAIAILPVIYMFCALGFQRLMQQYEKGSVALLGVAVLIFLCLGSNFFYIVPSRLRNTWLGKTPAIPDEILEAALLSGDVYLDLDSFEFDTSGLDAYASLALSTLLKEFHPKTNYGNVHLFRGSQKISSPNAGKYFYWKGYSKNISKDFWISNDLQICGDVHDLFFHGKVLQEVPICRRSS